MLWWRVVIVGRGGDREIGVDLHVEGAGKVRGFPGAAAAVRAEVAVDLWAV